jgi:hypothetical protein
MIDDLFRVMDPPPGAVSRLRVTLRRRAQRRRRSRAAMGATIVLAAVLAMLRMSWLPVPAPSPTTVAAFDVSLHPALALVDDAVLPPVALRGSPGPSATLLRRATLDEDVLLYELAP